MQWPKKDSQPHQNWEETLFALVVPKAVYQGRRRQRGEFSQNCELNHLSDIFKTPEVKQIKWWDSISCVLLELGHNATGISLHQHFTCRDLGRQLYRSKNKNFRETGCKEKWLEIANESIRRGELLAHLEKPTDPQNSPQPEDTPLESPTAADLKRLETLREKENTLLFGLWSAQRARNDR